MSYEKPSECPICYENKDLALLYCGHYFCNECISKINKCSLCRRFKFSNNYVFLYDIFFLFHYSIFPLYFYLFRISRLIRLLLSIVYIPFFFHSIQHLYYFHQSFYLKFNIFKFLDKLRILHMDSNVWAWINHRVPIE